MKRCLVVGANGFLGGAVAARLGSSGWDVRGICGPDDRPRGYGAHRYWPGIFSSDELRLGEIDVVVYAAGSVLPRHGVSLEEVRVRDVAPFRELVMAAESTQHPMTVVLFSSAGTLYGATSADAPATEDSPVRPVSTYGVSRHEMELLLTDSSSRAPLTSVVLRVSNAYGPGQGLRSGSSFVLRAACAALTGQALQVVDGARPTKDFVFVDDVTEAVSCVAETAIGTILQPTVFNVCSGRSHSLGEVVEIVQRVTGRTIQTLSVAGYEGDVTDVHLSAERAAAQLGWMAQMHLEGGIARLAAWLSRHALGDDLVTLFAEGGRDGTSSPS